MTLYVRAYEDFSYEIIFVDGIIRKNRVHLLINPSKHVKLPGQGEEEDPVLNIESLTHIISMETSVKNPQLIDRTVYIAERTNKPIITNQSTADIFKGRGLSVKQLRILGFQEEIVEGVQIDPVYLEEIIEEPEPDGKKGADDERGNIFGSGILDFGKSIVNKMNPLKWKPVKSISNIVKTSEETLDVDPTKPVAYSIQLRGGPNILFPTDRRGIININRVIHEVSPDVLLIVNQDVSFTKNIGKGLHKVIILNNQITDDQLLVLPKSHNIDVKHDTFYGALRQWVEIK